MRTLTTCLTVLNRR